jgi:NifU-like protein involved in Fe-S cluster formation
MFSERLMRIFQGATHQGELPEANHVGVAGLPGCGPYVILAFRVEEGVVTRARFETYGCPTAIACAEIVCTICEGRPLARLPPVTAADVTLLAGGVPEGKEQCPALAVQALSALAPLGAPAET